MSESATSLGALCSTLLRAGPPELLDAPLSALAEHTDDESARELLDGVYESGEAATLRELLSGGRLERFIDTTCTAREEQVLRAQLLRWGGQGASPHDDPERLTRIPEPPEDSAGLTRWARAYGVEAALNAQRNAVEPSDVTRGGSLLGDLDRVRSEHQELLTLAQSRAALTARSALWKAPVAAALAHLAQRLRGVFEERGLEALMRVRFSASRPVHIDLETGVVKAHVFVPDAGDHATCSLLLSGYEQRAIDTRCSCEKRGCDHVAALAARLFDACVGPDDRLHTALLTFCSQPSWKRFLDAVRGDAADERERKEDVTFRLSVADDGELRLSAYTVSRHVRGARGTRLVAPKQLLRNTPPAEDVPVLEAMVSRRSAGAHSVTLDLTLLRSLVEHPRVKLEGAHTGLTLVEERLEVTLTELPEGLLPGLSLRGVPLASGLPARDRHFLYALDRATSRLVFAELTPALRRMLGALQHFRGVLPKESFAALASVLSGFRHAAHVQTPPVLLGREHPAPKKLTLSLARAATEGMYATLSMSPLPLGAPWPPGRGPELVHGLVDGLETHTRRDLAFERAAALRTLTALGLTDSMRTGEFAYHVPDDQRALTLIDAAARLHDELFIAWAEPSRALSVKGALRPSQLSIRLFKKGDWFVLAARDQRDAHDVPLVTLFDAARRGERYVKIDGDSYMEIAEDLRERLLRTEPMVRGVERELRVSQNALPRVADAFGGESVELDASALSLVRAAAREPAREEISLPTTMVLRDYQSAGLNFLLQRSRWATGVCLADEMGLGKTVQCIALLWQRRALGPQLVVAPTSVVGNWLAEIARFAPEMRAISYMGKDRKARLAGIGANAVLVASYDVLLRDRTELAAHSFATQIVDEAQWIKNARTERFRAVDAIDAQFRVALSGTPLENRIGDLYSLFALVAPGLLGAWPRFRARFAVPIERYEDRERAAALRALIAPFFLRREKREVASELPARTEVVHRVELSAPERELYGAAVREARRALELRGRDPRVPRVKVLAELTRLRQLACHPRLIFEAPGASSSKQRALLALLDDLLPRGHRVLLFSQFTRHLRLVHEALTARGIVSLTLTGETPAEERRTRVEAFQAGAAPVFLISLKAGGAGLNLTSADYVIHLDPWWNPAAEDQASDRAHRIGQTRPVTVVKLVCEGTIEEKVLSLHAHKRRLFTSLFEGDTDDSADVKATALEELLDDEGDDARTST